MSVDDASLFVEQVQLDAVGVDPAGVVVGRGLKGGQP
jgi:hypothetical protein